MQTFFQRQQEGKSFSPTQAILLIFPLCLKTSPTFPHEIVTINPLQQISYHLSEPCKQNTPLLLPWSRHHQSRSNTKAALKHFGDVVDLWPASCALIPTAPRSWRGTFHRSHWGQSLATSLRRSGQCWWWCRQGQKKSLCHQLQHKTQISTDLYLLKCVCCYCESVHYNTYEVLTEVVYTGLWMNEWMKIYI